MFEQPLVSTKNPHYKWFVAASLMTGTLTFAISQTSINLALPKMMADLRVDVDEIKWILTAFMITTTIMTPTVGWLGNRLGNKRLYILSLLCFILGSVLSGLAWDYHSLVFFRILQALGGGPMFPAAMTIMYAAFPPQERGMALGIASGLLLGLASIYAKGLALFVAQSPQGHVLQYALTSPYAPLTLLANLVGFFLLLGAFREERASIILALSATLSNVVPILAAMALLGERLPADPRLGMSRLLAFILTLGGAALLVRLNPSAKGQ